MSNTEKLLKNKKNSKKSYIQKMNFSNLVSQQSNVKQEITKKINQVQDDSEAQWGGNFMVTIKQITGTDTKKTKSHKFKITDLDDPTKDITDVKIYKGRRYHFHRNYWHDFNSTSSSLVNYSKRMLQVGLSKIIYVQINEDPDSGLDIVVLFDWQKNQLDANFIFERGDIYEFNTDYDTVQKKDTWDPNRVELAISEYKNGLLNEQYVPYTTGWEKTSNGYKWTVPGNDVWTDTNKKIHFYSPSVQKSNSARFTASLPEEGFNVAGNIPGGIGGTEHTYVKYGDPVEITNGYARESVNGDFKSVTINDFTNPSVSLMSYNSNSFYVQQVGDGSLKKSKRLFVIYVLTGTTKIYIKLNDDNVTRTANRSELGNNNGTIKISEASLFNVLVKPDLPTNLHHIDDMKTIPDNSIFIKVNGFNKYLTVHNEYGNISVVGNEIPMGVNKGKIQTLGDPQRKDEVSSFISTTLTYVPDDDDDDNGDDNGGGGAGGGGDDNGGGGAGGGGDDDGDDGDDDDGGKRGGGGGDDDGGGGTNVTPVSGKSTYIDWDQSKFPLLMSTSKTNKSTGKIDLTVKRSNDTTQSKFWYYEWIPSKDFSGRAFFHSNEENMGLDDSIFYLNNLTNFNGLQVLTEPELVSTSGRAGGIFGSSGFDLGDIITRAFTRSFTVTGEEVETGIKDAATKMKFTIRKTDGNDAGTDGVTLHYRTMEVGNNSAIVDENFKHIRTIDDDTELTFKQNQTIKTIEVDVLKSNKDETKKIYLHLTPSLDSKGIPNFPLDLAQHPLGFVIGSGDLVYKQFYQNIDLTPGEITERKFNYTPKSVNDGARNVLLEEITLKQWQDAITANLKSELTRYKNEKIVTVNDDVIINNLTIKELQKYDILTLENFKNFYNADGFLSLQDSGDNDITKFYRLTVGDEGVFYNIPKIVRGGELWENTNNLIGHIAVDFYTHDYHNNAVLGRKGSLTKIGYKEDLVKSKITLLVQKTYPTTYSTPVFNFFITDDNEDRIGGSDEFYSNISDITKQIELYIYRYNTWRGSTEASTEYQSEQVKALNSDQKIKNFYNRLETLTSTWKEGAIASLFRLDKGYNSALAVPEAPDYTTSAAPTTESTIPITEGASGGVVKPNTDTSTGSGLPVLPSVLFPELSTISSDMTPQSIRFITGGYNDQYSVPAKWDITTLNLNGRTFLINANGLSEGDGNCNAYYLDVNEWVDFPEDTTISKGILGNNAISVNKPDNVKGNDAVVRFEITYDSRSTNNRDGSILEVEKNVLFYGPTYVNNLYFYENKFTFTPPSVVYYDIHMLTWGSDGKESGKLFFNRTLEGSSIIIESGVDVFSDDITEIREKELRGVSSQTYRVTITEENYLQYFESFKNVYLSTITADGKLAITSTTTVGDITKDGGVSGSVMSGGEWGGAEYSASIPVSEGRSMDFGDVTFEGGVDLGDTVERGGVDLGDDLGVDLGGTSTGIDLDGGIGIGYTGGDIDLDFDFGDVTFETAVGDATFETAVGDDTIAPDAPVDYGVDLGGTVLDATFETAVGDGSNSSGGVDLGGGTVISVDTNTIVPGGSVDLDANSYYDDMYGGEKDEEMALTSADFSGTVTTLFNKEVTETEPTTMEQNIAKAWKQFVGDAIFPWSLQNIPGDVKPPVKEKPKKAPVKKTIELTLDMAIFGSHGKGSGMMTTGPVNLTTFPSEFLTITTNPLPEVPDVNTKRNEIIKSKANTLNPQEKQAIRFSQLNTGYSVTVAFTESNIDSIFARFKNAFNNSKDATGNVVINYSGSTKTTTTNKVNNATTAWNALISHYLTSNTVPTWVNRKLGLTMDMFLYGSHGKDSGKMVIQESKYTSFPSEFLTVKTDPYVKDSLLDSESKELIMKEIQIIRGRTNLNYDPVLSDNEKGAIRFAQLSDGTFTVTMAITQTNIDVGDNSGFYPRFKNAFNSSKDVNGNVTITKGGIEQTFSSPVKAWNEFIVPSTIAATSWLYQSVEITIDMVMYGSYGQQSGKMVIGNTSYMSFPSEFFTIQTGPYVKDSLLDTASRKLIMKEIQIIRGRTNLNYDPVLSTIERQSIRFTQQDGGNYKITLAVTQTNIDIGDNSGFYPRFENAFNSSKDVNGNVKIIKGGIEKTFSTPTKAWNEFIVGSTLLVSASWLSSISENTDDILGDVVPTISGSSGRSSSDSSGVNPSGNPLGDPLGGNPFGDDILGGNPLDVPTEQPASEVDPSDFYFVTNIRLPVKDNNTGFKGKVVGNVISLDQRNLYNLLYNNVVKDLGGKLSNNSDAIANELETNWYIEISIGEKYERFTLTNPGNHSINGLVSLQVTPNFPQSFPDEDTTFYEFKFYTRFVREKTRTTDVTDENPQEPPTKTDLGPTTTELDPPGNTVNLFDLDKIKTNMSVQEYAKRINGAKLSTNTFSNLFIPDLTLNIKNLEGTGLDKNDNEEINTYITNINVSTTVDGSKKLVKSFTIEGSNITNLFGKSVVIKPSVLFDSNLDNPWQLYNPLTFTMQYYTAAAEQSCEINMAIKASNGTVKSGGKNYILAELTFT